MSGKLVRSAWVMHLIVPDPKGPMESKKPPGAAAAEAALRKCPGSIKDTIGNPGQRFRIACNAVRRSSLVHRVTTEPSMVNCPKCIEEVQRAAHHRAQDQLATRRPDRRRA